MVKALITGVTGQDGGYLAEKLIEEGVDVHGLARPADSSLVEVQRNCPALIIHECDLTNRQALEAIVSTLEPDEIYNLAGISSVAQSWKQPVLTAEVNGLAVACLLQTALITQERAGKTISVIQASSAEIFGSGDGAARNESTPLRPTSPYGASKAYAHQLGQVYRARGLHAVNAILFNHESTRRPVSFVSRKITAGVAAIATGIAEELVLGNLDARRDWGWAPDYVDAMVRALRYSEATDFVIATGDSHSVRDFADAAFARIGILDSSPYLKVNPQLLRPADAKAQVGDASKALELLGWKPTIAFETMVSLMVDYDFDLLRAG